MNATLTYAREQAVQHTEHNDTGRRTEPDHTDNQDCTHDGRNDRQIDDADERE